MAQQIEVGRIKSEPRLGANGDLIFESAFTHAAIGISITDLTGRFVEANPAFCKLTGYSRAELRGLDFQNLVHASDLDRMTAQIDALLAGEIPALVIEKQIVRKDGEVISVQNSTSLVRDETGRPRSFLRLTENVTELNETKRALAKTENRFEAFMKSLPGYAWIKDADGRYVYMNRSLEAIVPADCKSWIGKTDSDLWPGRIAAENRRNDLEVLREQREMQVVENWEHDGEARWVCVSKFPIVGEDGDVMVGGTSIDITDHKTAETSRAEAERKYRDIFENASEGIFQSTPEGKYIVANPALARMYGYGSPEELIAECHDISRQIYADSTRRDEFKRLMDTDGAVSDFEVEIFRHDGSKVWISVNARAVRGARGRILYYEGTSEDITERKRAEEKSAAFAALARKLSGARTRVEAGSIIASTAQDLFSWDACNLDLYDSRLDVVIPLLNIDTIEGRKVDVTPHIAKRPPTNRTRRVIDHGPELELREEPFQFEQDAVPFGDMGRPSASIMASPMQHRSEVVGLLSIHSYTPNVYDEAALRDFAALADYCGAAINRIQAEDELRESEERFRQFAEHVEDVVWVSDRDLSTVLYINPSYERVFGRSCESVYQCLRSFLEVVHPEDREKVEHTLEEQRKGNYRPLEYRIVTPDGSVRWINHRSFPIKNRDGEIYRLAGLAQDITERKVAQEELRESERRFRDLFENSRDAIYLHDMAGRYISVNRAAEELTGYTRAEILGRDFTSFVPAHYVPKIRQFFCEKLETSGATMYEVELITKEGQHVPVEVSSRLIFRDGQAIGVQGTARNISERKISRDMLRGYSRKLVEAQETERKRIARELHDEIGQVLTAVKINLQSVQRTCEDVSGGTRIEESLAVVDEALDRVRELSLELRPCLLDDLGLAIALRWYLKRYTERTRILAEITSDFEDEFRLPRKVEIAAFRISQEALNNVARHAEASEVRIVLNRSQDEFLLSIVDDGRGFDVEELMKRPKARAFGIHGIEERAFAVNGSVDIQSVPGNGTSLNVRFPLKRKKNKATEHHG